LPYKPSLTDTLPTPYISADDMFVVETRLISKAYYIISQSSARAAQLKAASPLPGPNALGKTSPPTQDTVDRSTCLPRHGRSSGYDSKCDGRCVNFISTCEVPAQRELQQSKCVKDGSNGTDTKSNK
jgi:hypothetical protein